jgi:hypothetical protein
LHPKHGKEQYINHGRDIISGSNDQEILRLRNYIQTPGVSA